jgi:hypothetical protein
VQQHPVQPTASSAARNAQAGEKSLSRIPQITVQFSAFMSRQNWATGDWLAGSSDIWSRYAGDAQAKKEEFTGLMVTWCLGTPFPRSALFLV